MKEGSCTPTIPMPTISTEAELKEALVSMRKQYAPFLAEFAPKVSKMLQVENGMKFETTAKNEKMEENAKRLKEVLNGIIPDNVLDNRPINIHQTGAVRASQSGQSINLHNNETQSSCRYSIDAGSSGGGVGFHFYLLLYWLAL